MTEWLIPEGILGLGHQAHRKQRGCSTLGTLEGLGRHGLKGDGEDGGSEAHGLPVKTLPSCHPSPGTAVC